MGLVYGSTKEKDIMVYYITFQSHGEYSAFIRWFEKEIGTEYDSDRHDDGSYTVTVFEVTDSEISHIVGKWK